MSIVVAIKSLQNHVLNVTGLPDLDRALLQNPTIKKVLGGISENNKVKTNLLIMNHIKKGVHPNKLFPHHDTHEEHLNSIQDVIKHMKKEDLDKLVNHYESDKPTHKYAKILLGLYGFGFKGSTANIGKKITVITSPSTKEYYKFVIVHKELGKMGLEPEIEAETLEHDATSKKLFISSSPFEINIPE